MAERIVDAKIDVSANRVTVEGKPAPGEEPLREGKTFRVDAGDTITWKLKGPTGASAGFHARVIFVSAELFGNHVSFETTGGTEIKSVGVDATARPTLINDPPVTYLYRFELDSNGTPIPLKCVTKNGAHMSVEAQTCGGEKGGAPRVANDQVAAKSF